MITACPECCGERGLPCSTCNGSGYIGTRPGSVQPLPPRMLDADGWPVLHPSVVLTCAACQTTARVEDAPSWQAARFQTYQHGETDPDGTIHLGAPVGPVAFLYFCSPKCYERAPSLITQREAPRAARAAGETWQCDCGNPIPVCADACCVRCMKMDPR